MPHEVFIALGTNLGDRSKNLRSAIEQMQPEILPVLCSPVYETSPWGYTPQPDFLNQVVQAKTGLLPRQLLSYLKNIEASMGRVETIRNGPRIIDLDILFYDDLVLKSPPLEIPHPALQERAFVLVPLGEIAPEFRHPITGATVRHMLASVDTASVWWFSDSKCGYQEFGE